VSIGDMEDTNITPDEFGCLASFSVHF